MKRCIDCRWYSMSIMSPRCSNCKQVNPHKTTDNWEPPPSQAGCTPPRTIVKPPSVLAAEYLREILEPLGMSRDSILEFESCVNPMIVIEAKLK